MRKKFKTSLQLAILNTLATYVNVNVQQIGQPIVVPYPPYPMWYNIIPPFVPMDPNMYSMYYSRIKGLDPLIFKRKEKYIISHYPIKFDATYLTIGVDSISYKSSNFWTIIIDYSSKRCTCSIARWRTACRFA